MRTDGETGVGSVAGTLSLGGQGEITVETKKHNMEGKDIKDKIVVDDPVLKGCEMEKERRELKQQQLEDGENTQEDYAAALTTVRPATTA